ncbi:biotin-dependent carboxyltransferase family protein [Planctomycetes bacterium K23_9]|uniref:KipI antagonist n=1 Tax=Stieleria marina TaxID=1930275 RepID=A0A517NRS0_9BACT|nr:KipI antagonist [Planctomycetes bacterium K23_9]
MIRVHRGMYRFVQAADYSRLHAGYAPSGPQDRFSCQMTNQLLGNDPLAGAIEFTLAPAALTIQQDCHLVVGGAPCECRIDGAEQPEWTVVQANAGSEMTIRLGPTGCRVYVGMAGGVEANLDASVDAAGVFRGNPLAAKIGRTLRVGKQSWAPEFGVVRVLPGPEFESSLADDIADRHWEIAEQSNSVGLRLAGKKLPLPSYDILSAPVQDGTIQATQSGLLALLRDRGTLGGYPRVATVIDCDVDRLAQFRPGQQLRFQWVDQNEAIEAIRLQQLALSDLQSDVGRH